jgi:hypothetical protein
MDKAYWIGRQRAAMALAQGATTSQKRLDFYELAGRHSIRAAQSPPFLLVERGPANDGEREALRSPHPSSARPGSIFRGPLLPRNRPFDPHGERR